MRALSPVALAAALLAGCATAPTAPSASTAAAGADCAEARALAERALSLPRDHLAYATCAFSDDGEAWSAYLKEAHGRAGWTALGDVKSPRRESLAAELGVTDEPGRLVWIVRGAGADAELAKPLNKNEAGAGGVLGFFAMACSGVFGKPGHYDLTSRALEQLEPSWKDHDVVDFFADASQDPDFYEWGHPEAHAQTPNVPVTGADPGDPDKARGTFVAWTTEKLGRAKAACDAGRHEEAAYWAGYSLHALQDLATHQGRTNAEHSWNAKLDKDSPDVSDRYLAMAQEVTGQALKGIRENVLKACWRSLDGKISSSKMAKSWKTGKLGKWDLSRKEVHKYEALADVYAKACPTPREIRWFRYDQNPEAYLLKVLEDLGLRGGTGGAPAGPKGGP